MRDFAAEELGDYILLYRRVPNHYAAIPMKVIHKMQVSFRTSGKAVCDGLCKTAHLPSCSWGHPITLVERLHMTSA